MLKIEFIEMYGWATALRGLKRPYNKERTSSEEPALPSDDEIRLMRNLVVSGDDHAKVLRMIGVGVTIQAPRYWWMEFDTYSIGRFDLDEEHISESTMHRKISSSFNENDFEEDGMHLSFEMNTLVQKHRDDPCILTRLKSHLPEGFLQTRDVLLNYQALRRIYRGRRNHKLPHWHQFCEWIHTLPYADALITVEGNY